jgi:cytochrome c oxidase subunit 2
MANRIHTILGSLVLLGIVACIYSLSIAGDMKTFEVKADAYKFIPDTITVNQGDRVIIRAISIDKDHGLGIKAYNISKPMPKGKWITIEFKADKKGEFPIHCTKFCGWKHHWMRGKLIVK